MVKENPPDKRYGTYGAQNIMDGVETGPSSSEMKGRDPPGRVRCEIHDRNRARA